MMTSWKDVLMCGSSFYMSPGDAITRSRLLAGAFAVAAPLDWTLAAGVGTGAAAGCAAAGALVAAAGAAGAVVAAGAAGFAASVGLAAGAGDCWQAASKALPPMIDARRRNSRRLSD